MEHRITRLATLAVLVLATAAALPTQAGTAFGISVGGPGFSVSIGTAVNPVYSPAWGSASFSLSFESLASYGEWIHVPGLGRVWRPWVAPDWRPYTWGRWVFTSVGWTWVAYEPWGYLPHHYGSWALTTFGWVWRPGYVYHPANVVWVSHGTFLGWYPAGPPGWSHARRSYLHGYRHGYADGYRDGWRDARYATFVEWNRFTAGNVARVARPGAELHGLSPHSVRRLEGPPARRRVERLTGSPVRTVPVAERTVRMGDRSVRAVRPEGVARSVERYAPEVVRTALAPSVSRRTGRGVAPTPARDVPRADGRPGAAVSSRPRRAAPGRSVSRDPLTGERPAGAATVRRDPARAAGGTETRLRGTARRAPASPRRAPSARRPQGPGASSARVAARGTLRTPVPRAGSPAAGRRARPRSASPGRAPAGSGRWTAPVSRRGTRVAGTSSRSGGRPAVRGKVRPHPDRSGRPSPRRTRR